jgi:hypothetical protein
MALENRKLIAIALIAFVVICSAQSLLAQPATFYVNYQNAPTPDRSFRTIEEAQQAVREFLKSQQKPGDVTVLIEGGTHFLAAPLKFTADDTPAIRETTVTYKPNPQSAAPVVLSGGGQVNGWQPAGRLWTTKVPAGWNFRELFVNGERRTRARSPTTGFFRVAKAGADKRTSFAFKPGDLKWSSKLSQAEVVFLHDWSISRVAVADLDEKSNTIRLQAPIGRPPPYFAIDNFEKHPRYAIENAPDLLDSPGEWYLDAETGIVTYWPVAGEKIDTAHIIAPRLTSLLVVQGDEAGGRPVRNLRFEGLRFMHCAWALPPGGYAESQATMHSARHGDPQSPTELIPAAVTFDAAEDCALDRCYFEHLGGSAIWLRRGCKNNRISSCRIRDVAANGVNIGEPQVAPRSATSAAAAINPVSQGNAVVHNRIEHCGTVFHGAVGVWVGMAKATDVSSNEIKHLPYTAVSVGWNWTAAPTVCEGHLITANHIHHVMQILSDGAGIYTLGRQPGTILRGNVIHDVSVNAGRAESNGIFMDEGSSEMLVESNVIYNIAKSPIRFHKAGTNTVRNNQLVTRRRTPPFRYNDTKERLISMEGNQVMEAQSWTPPPAFSGRSGNE